MSEVKNASKSQRVHNVSESRSTLEGNLPDSRSTLEDKGMAFTGYGSSWESHNDQRSGGACKDDTRSSGRNGVPSMFGGNSACKRSYDAGETGRAASSTVLDRLYRRNSRLRARRTPLSVSVLGEIHNSDESHLLLPTDHMRFTIRVMI